MRTISIRLDDKADATLRQLCERDNLSQTDVVKSALERLAEDARPTPASLAAKLGLIGGFASDERDLALNHSERLKERLHARAKRPPGQSQRARTKTGAKLSRGRRAG